MILKNRLPALLVALASTLASSLALAIPIQEGGAITPYILAGAPPDSPSARVDANVPSSRFSGVVSINIRYDGNSFICSGALVGDRQVVTAGHCVDTDGKGHVIDVSKPYSESGMDVRVVFNAAGNGTTANGTVVTASAVSMNPNYQGFGVCPAGVPGFCVNDDVAVITLPTDAPTEAKRYRMFGDVLGVGQQTILAGYGTSGDGINGFTVSPNFFIKRSGGNVLDIFEGDDETYTGVDANGFFTSTGKNEVWYADFDGTNSRGVLRDSACTFFGVCTAQLANDVETNIGGGDSGGPSFIEYMGELFLVGNNTFGWSGFGEEHAGAFGAMFGGILFSAYEDYLRAATGGAIRIVHIPEPGALALFGIAFAGLMASRRRKAFMN